MAIGRVIAEIYTDTQGHGFAFMTKCYILTLKSELLKTFTAISRTSGNNILTKIAYNDEKNLEIQHFCKINRKANITYIDGNNISHLPLFLAALLVK